MKEIIIHLENEAATLALAARVAQHCQQGGVIALSGDLGAGKTTFCRGLLRSMGYHGNVKSPTYTLVETYELSQLTIYHFDLYRLASAEELEFMGFRDYFGHNALSLIEWPQQGEGFLPAVDLHVYLKYQQPGRQVRLVPCSVHGEQMLAGVA